MRKPVVGVMGASANDALSAPEAARVKVLAEELGAAIATNSPRQASEMLIAKARQRAAGTPGDNCTLAIVKFVEIPVEAKRYTVERMSSAV